jgi:hypothetical protein
LIFESALRFANEEGVLNAEKAKGRGGALAFAAGHRVVVA